MITEYKYKKDSISIHLSKIKNKWKYIINNYDQFIGSFTFNEDKLNDILTDIQNNKYRLWYMATERFFVGKLPL